MFTEGVYLSQVWMGSQISQKFLPSKIRPLTAHIKFTENCQAKCISCDYWKSRWEDSMDTARAIRLVNEVGEAGIRNLRFTGGEPFLREDFADADDTPIELIARHAAYVAERIGSDHVGLGSDFDGAPVPDELGDVAGVPKLLDALAAVGFSDAELNAIAWDNWRRVLGDWWRS